MEAAISIEGLGKRYRLGQHHGEHSRITEALGSVIRAPLRAVRRRPADPASYLWALRDVEFEIQPGEVVGLVGRNGAGKSTLLKVLSRVTEPTTGQAALNGRVGSLLEVGTGFHLELTGRENVFLSGAILGMRRAEIRRRFDEIVEFAEVGEFIDTPIKRYSSGMAVRLGFAVAAYLEPEILIIDEVLAVGDAAFQRKCLGKLEDVAAEDGRTILFVSHNMPAVKAICSRAVYLECGTVKTIGDAATVVKEYLDDASTNNAEQRWEETGVRPGDDGAQLVAVRVAGADGRPATTIFSSETASVEVEIDLREVPAALSVGFDLYGDDGTLVLRSAQTDVPDRDRPVLRPGLNVIRCAIPPGLLNDGGYTISPRASIHGVRTIFHVDAAVHFEVVYDHGESEFLRAAGRPGVIAPILDWSGSIVG